MSLFSSIRNFVEEPIRAFSVIDSRRIGSHIQQVTFEVLDGQRSPFPIGSYIQFMIHDIIPRAYSVAESHEGTVSIIVSFAGHGVGSRFFSEVPIGTRVNGFGPFDDFPFRTSTNRKKIFIATGTGVAPFVRMVPMAIHEGVPCAVLLGSPTEEDLPYKEYFVDLSRTYPNLFTFFPVLSRPTNSWQGGRGYVTSYLPEILQDDDLSSWELYICGVPVMIYDVKRMLKSLQFSKQQTFIQEFR